MFYSKNEYLKSVSMEKGIQIENSKRNEPKCTTNEYFILKKKHRKKN